MLLSVFKLLNCIKRKENETQKRKEKKKKEAVKRFLKELNISKGWYEGIQWSYKVWSFTCSLPSGAMTISWYLTLGRDALREEKAFL